MIDSGGTPFTNAELTLMKPDPRFLDLDPVFWANVKSLSQSGGYTRGGRIKVHSVAEIRRTYQKLGLSAAHLFAADDTPTELGQRLLDYLRHRADTIHDLVVPSLMTAAEADAEFEKMRMRLGRPRTDFSLNKQKGEKKRISFLTALVTMVAQEVFGTEVVTNPLALSTVTGDGLPVRTLSRRVDGAYPSTVNPVGIYEIKEYYYTTSFGSRIADGVYETMLDGLEIAELNAAEHIHLRHVLMVDARDTWWSSNGKSYLCRMVDMAHQRLVDEVLFGREVVTRWPEIAREWKAARELRDAIPPEA